MKKWSRKYDSCIGCNCTHLKHMAHGLCVKCYARKYAEENPEKVKSHKHSHYLKVQKLKGKQTRDDLHFDGNREIVLTRDNFQCVKCGAAKSLVVHHIDGNGRGSDNPNNELSNLVTLCRSCHMKEHQIAEKRQK